MKNTRLLKLGILSTTLLPLAITVSCGSSGSDKKGDPNNPPINKDNERRKNSIFLDQLNSYLIQKHNETNNEEHKIKSLPSELSLNTNNMITKLFQINTSSDEWIKKSNGVTFSDLKVTPRDNFGELEIEFKMEKGEARNYFNSVRFSNLFTPSQKQFQLD